MIRQTPQMSLPLLEAQRRGPSFMSPVIAFLATLILTTTVTAQPLIQRIGEPLSHPWGMDFLDDKTLLVTERGGQLYRVDLMTGNRTTIGNVPAGAGRATRRPAGCSGVAR